MPTGGPDESVFILVGGNNGEVEVITYGQQSTGDEQDYPTQRTKVITTLWKNSGYLMTMLSFGLRYLWLTHV
jgi:hypothetical protein